MEGAKQALVPVESLPVHNVSKLKGRDVFPIWISHLHILLPNHM
jgi:hypothetical protein